MFERFDEPARRAIFLAGMAAIAEKSKAVGLLHLLAGIRKEAPGLFKGVNLEKAKIKLLRLSPTELQTAGKTPVTLPLDAKAKRALLAAAKIAEKFGSNRVGPAHQLLGLLRSDASLGKKLQKAGVMESRLKKLLGQNPRNKEAAARPLSSRSGIGYDLHRMIERRRLILGGIQIPFEKGPEGHSDGDVLSHAVCDALLGAASLGDIGTHFPDTDPKWRGVSSLVFLRQIRQYLERRNWKIRHIDAIVVAERPRLGPHFPAMRESLAKALGIAPGQINLKAKTHEGLGEIGRGEAIAAHAIATLES